MYRALSNNQSTSVAEAALFGSAPFDRRGRRRAALLSHTTLTGDIRDYFVSHFLASHLRGRFVVGKGAVVDTYGNRSRQQDVVIYGNSVREPGYGPYELFLIEGVAAGDQPLSPRARVSTRALWLGT